MKTKKRALILLAVLVVVLTACFAVACNKDDKTPVEPGAQTYTMTFVDALVGSDLQPIVAEAGADISERLPKLNDTDSYYFGGWTAEQSFASPYVQLPATMPDSDVTYYAKWTRRVTIRPQLQKLSADYQPVAGEYEYKEGTEFSFDIDPTLTSVDLYNNADFRALAGVEGFTFSYDNNTLDDFRVSISAKNTVVSKLKYDRDRSRLEYTANISGIDDDIFNNQGGMYYTGAKVTVIDFLSVLEENDMSLPIGRRFAGWSTHADGSGDFAGAGEEITIGEGNYVGGTITLNAVCLEGYRDYAHTYDYVYIDKFNADEEGVKITGPAYFERYVSDGDSYALVDEIEGTFTELNILYKNYVGEFSFELESRTVQKGRYYQDGHFAYSLYGAGNITGDYILRDPATGERDPRTKVTILDMYGGAILELGEGTRALGFEGGDFEYTGDVYDVPAGSYTGGYWWDDVNEDYCFCAHIDVGGTDVVVEVHFKLASRLNEKIMTLRGTEAGVYASRGIEDGRLAGTLVILDGYGQAMLADENNVGWEGEYDIFNEELVYILATSDAGITEPIALRVSKACINVTTVFLPIYKCEIGDPAKFGYYVAEDGSEVLLDGFGGATYVDENGNAYTNCSTNFYGTDLQTGYPAAVTVTSGAKRWHLIFDNVENVMVKADGYVQSAREVYIEGEEKPTGALFKAGTRTYYTSFGYNEIYDTVCTEVITSTTGTSEDTEGGIFLGENGYAFAYEVSTADAVTTSGLRLNDLSFKVLDATGQDVGTLTVSASTDGKAGTVSYDATYVYGGETIELKGTDKTYSFMHSALYIDGEPVFIVDDLVDPTVCITKKYEMYSSASMQQLGLMYVFCHGVMAFLKSGTSNDVTTEEDKFPFFDYGELILNLDQVTYTINVPGNQFIVCARTKFFGATDEEKQEAILVTQSDMLTEASMTPADRVSDQLLSVDTFGNVSYMENVEAKDEDDMLLFHGYYYLNDVDGVYKFVGYRATGQDENKNFIYDFNEKREFTFTISSPTLGSYEFNQTFIEVYYCVDAATIDEALYILYMTSTQSDVALYVAEPDDDALKGYARGDKIAKAAVTKEGDVYTLTFTENEQPKSYKFVINDSIFSFKCAMLESENLLSGTYTSGDGESKVEVDKMGQITYTKGKDTAAKTYTSFYSSDPNLNEGVYFMHPLEATEDSEFEGLRFMIVGGKLVTIGEDDKTSVYDVEVKDTNYVLHYTEGQNSAILYNETDTAEVVAGSISKDSNNIYTFTTTAEASVDFESFRFMIDGLKVAVENDAYKFTYNVLGGNYYLKGNNTYCYAAGSVKCEGFLQLATYTDGDGANHYGALVPDAEVEGLIAFIIVNDEGEQEIAYYFQTQEDDELALRGDEAGVANEWIMAISSVSGAQMDLDGFGKVRARHIDEDTEELTEWEDIGYYWITSEADYDYILINKQAVAFDEAGKEKYDLKCRLYPLVTSSGELLYGYTPYIEQQSGAIKADDGTIMLFDGYDTIELIISSIGRQEDGYYYDITGTGKIFLVMSTSVTAMYAIDFPTEGASEGVITARRVFYMTADTNIELHMYNKEDTLANVVSEKTHEPLVVPEGYDGYAEAAWFSSDSTTATDSCIGFYKLSKEGDTTIVTITLIDTNGNLMKETVEFAIYADGTCKYLY